MKYSLDEKELSDKGKKMSQLILTTAKLVFLKNSSFEIYFQQIIIQYDLLRKQFHMFCSNSKILIDSAKKIFEKEKSLASIRILSKKKIQFSQKRTKPN